MSVLSNMKKKREGCWQDDPPTERQLVAIMNMSDYLGQKYKEPGSKGQAAECIEELKRRVAAVISINKKDRRYAFLQEWTDDDWYYNHAYDLDIY